MKDEADEWYPQDANTIHDESDFPGVRAQLERYLAGAQQKADQADNKTSEIDLQRMSLDPLITFGERVLEDASDAIGDYTELNTTKSDKAAGTLRRST